MIKIFKGFIITLMITSCQQYKTDNDKSTVSDTEQIEIAETKKTQGFLRGENNMVNIGIVKKGDTIYQDFILYNDGKETVEILDVQRSCNCTNSILEKNVISVNDSTKFTMIIDTSSKHKGPNEVTSTLSTNGARKFYLLSTKFTIAE